MDAKITTYTEFRKVYDKVTRTWYDTGYNTGLLKLETAFPKFCERMSFDIRREINARNES